jgi:hypothetical protein
MCGTIALDFVEKGRLPLESIYCIDYGKTPWPFELESIAQFGRWCATRPGVAVRLMHAAHRHALAEGKRLGLAEAKPPIVGRVQEFGMVLVEISGATLQCQSISVQREGYYSTPPAPRLYLFDIDQNASALNIYIRSH